MGYVNELANRDPRPSVDFSYPKSVAEHDIPKSNTNKIQFLGSGGREITLSGEVWNDTDVTNLQNQVKNATVQTLDIPELQESINVIPTDISITEEVGQIDRHHYEITLKETS